MKKMMTLGLCALMSIGCISVSACSSGGGKLSPIEGQSIYTKSLAIYDTSVEEDYQIGIKLEYTEGKIEAITMSRYEVSEEQYGFKDGILTIDGAFFSQQGTGEKTLTISYEDGSVERASVLICTKVITTADEFQAINDNLSGIYALGNDIDLSSISNFEPLGRYYEETDPRNEYFHGTLEGNGHTVKNANVAFSELPEHTVEWSTKAENYPSDSDVYYNNFSSSKYGFKEDCHKAGDNIGLFQVIGSSGIVRNIHFDNINVVGRTIVGAIAGNVMGTLENCLVTNSSVKMATHFYDDDCNTGGVVGIVSSGANVNNVICYDTSVNVCNYFIDFGDDYINNPAGNGWDHPGPNAEGVELPEWLFAGVNKDPAEGSATSSKGKVLDSNGCETNGVYAFVGKCWGTCSNCYAESFTVAPQDGDSRTVCFGQTHVGVNKPTSGEVDLGQFVNCAVYSESKLADTSLYSAYDTDIWEITGTSIPTIKCPIISEYSYTK